jgi:hypothetical protein
MVGVSRLFSVDIEEFMKILEIISFTEYDIENKIEIGAYTKREILNELKEMNYLIKELNKIFISIVNKAQRYKPGDRNLFNYLNYINNYIEKLKLTGQIMEVAYQRDPDYGTNGLFRDLNIIRKYADLIKKEINKGIYNRLFA